MKAKKTKDVTSKKAKDLSPKTPARVKGGGRHVNDNLTLVGASPR